jgi:hypothetical protein
MPDYAPANYTGDGATTEFTIPWSYANPSDVYSTVDGVDEARTITNGGTTITFDVAPAVSAAIVIFRQTDVQTISPVYQNDTGLVAVDLNEAVQRTLYALQEQEYTHASDGGYGDIQLGDGATPGGFRSLDQGTEGQILTQGAGLDPEWQTLDRDPDILWDSDVDASWGASEVDPVIGFTDAAGDPRLANYRGIRIEITDYTRNTAAAVSIDPLHADGVLASTASPSSVSYHTTDSASTGAWNQTYETDVDSINTTFNTSGTASEMGLFVDVWFGMGSTYENRMLFRGAYRAIAGPRGIEGWAQYRDGGYAHQLAGVRLSGPSSFDMSNARAIVRGIR